MPDTFELIAIPALVINTLVTLRFRRSTQTLRVCLHFSVWMGLAFLAMALTSAVAQQGVKPVTAQSLNFLIGFNAMGLLIIWIHDSAVYWAAELVSKLSRQRQSGTLPSGQDGHD